MRQFTRDSSEQLVVAQIVWGLRIGGLERIVVDLINGTDPARFAHVVYCLEGEGELASELGASCRGLVAMGKRPGITYDMPLRLARLMRKDRVDLVHCHNFGPMLYGGAAGRMARVRAVVGTLHGTEAAEHRALGLLGRLRLFDQAIAISEHVRDTAIARGGLNPSDVITIMNGIDVGRYARTSAPRGAELTRADVGASGSDFLIGVVARLTHEKDHDTLLAAVSIVASKFPGVGLLIVGDGPRRSILEAKCTELGITRNVVFLGSRTDVPDLLPLLDLFALPSRVEGLGITLMEAMAYSLPTLATRVGGIPEVVVDGHTGLIVEPGVSSSMAAAIEWMIEHRTEAALMGQHGRERVDTEFDVSGMIQKYTGLYEGLVKGRPRRAHL